MSSPKSGATMEGKTMAYANVYRIINLKTGEFYIGATSSSTARRMSQHVATAFSGTRSNTGPLHASMRKYGSAAFAIEVVAKFPSLDEAYAEEKRLISTMKPTLNVMRGGVGREVVCLDDGNVFPTAFAAADHYNVSKSMVIEVCLRNPRRAQAGGRVFRYVGDVFDVQAELETARARTNKFGARSVANKTKPVKCISDGLVYGSALEAAKAYGTRANHITGVCSGDRLTTAGRRFVFVDEG